MPLGAFWGAFWAPWDHLGTVWGPFGVPLGTLGDCWVSFLALFTAFRCLWSFGSFGNPFWYYFKGFRCNFSTYARGIP